MRVGRFSIVPAVAMLVGCSQHPAATVQPAPTAQPHNFAVFEAQSNAFLVDTAEGKVWRLEGSGKDARFIPVEVAAVRGIGTGMSAEQCAKSQAEFAQFGGVALCTTGDADSKQAAKFLPGFHPLGPTPPTKADAGKPK